MFTSPFETECPAKRANLRKLGVLSSPCSSHEPGVYCAPLRCGLKPPEAEEGVNPKIPVTELLHKCGSKLLLLLIYFCDEVTGLHRNRSLFQWQVR